MAMRIQFRRGTATQWTNANPILAAGELGLETDTQKFKIGDGSTAWSGLSYSSLPSTSVSASTLTTKGDIFVATGASTVSRLAAGSSNQALVVDSSTATGLKWSNITATNAGDDDQVILGMRIFS
jgi:hypothetical protein